MWVRGKFHFASKFEPAFVASDGGRKMRTRILGKRGRRAERSSHFLLPISPHLRALKITSLFLFLKKIGNLPCFYLSDPFKSGCPRHLFLLSPPSAFIAPKGEKLGARRKWGVVGLAEKMERIHRTRRRERKHLSFTEAQDHVVQ